MSEKIDNILLVEGSDDVHVISALLHSRQLTKLRDENDKSIKPLKLYYNDIITLNVEPVGSNNGVIEKFTTQLRLSSNLPKHLGIVLDFDLPTGSQENNYGITLHDILVGENTKDRWHIPQEFSIPQDGGFIAEPTDKDNDVRIGIWLMPDNQNRGMLEDFLMRSVASNQQCLLKYAKRVAKVAKRNFVAPYNDCHQAKAEAHTFLAWMDEPGKPFGLSIKNNSFNANAPLITSFIEWLQKLFA